MKTVSKKKRRQLEQSSSTTAAGSSYKSFANKSSEAISAPFGILHPSKSIPTILDNDLLMKQYSECESATKCVDMGLHVLHNSSAWLTHYTSRATNPSLKRAMRALVQIQSIQAMLRGKYYLLSNDSRSSSSSGGGGIEKGSSLADFENLSSSSSSSSSTTATTTTIIPPTSKASKLESVLLDKKCLVAPAFASIKYDSSHIYSALSSPSPGFQTQYAVIAGDCLEVALSPPLKKQSPSSSSSSSLSSPFSNPCVLDMASMSLPGGGWRKASSAQEENLHRRTNLMHCLEDPYRVNPGRGWQYPLPQYGGVYIPNVIVFRGAETSGYPFLKKPQKVSIVAVAALKMPPTEMDTSLNEPVLDKKLAQDTLRKIYAILSIAIEHGHTFLVLSAFGCGAYMNPPGHMARLFKQALQEPRFAGRFSHVIFAILESDMAKRVVENQVEDASLLVASRVSQDSDAIKKEEKKGKEDHSKEEEEGEEEEEEEEEEGGEEGEEDVSGVPDFDSNEELLRTPLPDTLELKDERAPRHPLPALTSSVSSSSKSFHPGLKSVIFANTFGVNVLNPDGSVLYNLNSLKKTIK